MSSALPARRATSQRNASAFTMKERACKSSARSRACWAKKLADFGVPRRRCNCATRKMRERSS